MTRDVSLHNIVYKLYYLVLRPGVGESPCNVDGVFTSYRGDYLYRTVATSTTASELTTVKFEETIYPQTTLSLYSTIRGRKEVFPQFKTGTKTTNADGTVSNYDFGSGLMFIPSGLGYYSTGNGDIPAYVPLVFSFKLYEVQRLDIENNGITLTPDGVLSFQEDLNGDGYVWTSSELPDGAVNPDDTDKDGIPDFLDVDDDNDNYTTKLEITKPAGTNSGLSAYFPYNPIVDNPLTTAIETETKGIPEYSAAGTPDYTTPTRKRIHIDKEHHTAKP